MEIGGCLMRKLEFEKLENPNPVEVTLDEIIPVYPQIDMGPELFSPLPR